MICVGKKREEKVFVSPDVMNAHTLIIGKSGTGKTTLLQNLIIESVVEGHDCIVINWKNCGNTRFMQRETRENYEKRVKKIDVAEQGLALPLFTLDSNVAGKIEREENLIDRVTSLLDVACKLTASQRGIVNETIRLIFTDKLYAENGLEIVTDILKKSKYKVSQNAANRLSPICGGNIIHDGDFLLQDEKPHIYELDFNGFEKETQNLLVKFLLDYIDRLANKGKFETKGIRIFVDEAQALDFSRSSTISVILNERRKMGVGLVLAATELVESGPGNMREALQCATQFYFRPDEAGIHNLAIKIDPVRHQTWIYRLDKLQRGQFIACGKFQNEKKKAMPNALQLSTVFEEDLDQAVDYNKYIEGIKKVDNE